jgi:hypothetical protein
MTIHWKALEENFLTIQLVFNSTIFGENMHFLIFSLKKPQSLLRI